jgi:Protein of unknown function (DUF3866)
MIRVRRGVVREILEERPGAVEVSVEVEAGLARAICYPDLSGPIRPGDRVVLNTTATDLGLGTGGAHFVLSVEGAADREAEGPGHLMKLRYTPLQVMVEAVEEGPHAEAMREAESLEGTPVVWTPLHSMVGPAAAGAVAAGAERVAYVMTDHAALPAALSRSLPRLRAAGLLQTVITTGQSFGGDLEAVSVFSGLLAARGVAEADVIIVGDGPGSAGTATPWGASGLDSAMAVNAAGILEGRPVVALRISFADPRERHRGVSHHALKALSRVALMPAHVAVPALEGEQRETVWAALTEAELEGRHQLVEVTGRPAMDRLAEAGIGPESMGRGSAEDPVFFLAAGAAGVLAGRMAAGDRAWQRS